MHTFPILFLIRHLIMRQKQGMIGHDIVVFDDSVNMASQARFAMEFCSIESCENAHPAELAQRVAEVIDRITSNGNREQNLHLLNDLVKR